MTCAINFSRTFLKGERTTSISTMHETKVWHIHIKGMLFFLTRYIATFSSAIEEETYTGQDLGIVIKTVKSNLTKHMNSGYWRPSFSSAEVAPANGMKWGRSIFDKKILVSYCKVKKQTCHNHHLKKGPNPKHCPSIPCTYAARLTEFLQHFVFLLKNPAPAVSCTSIKMQASLPEQFWQCAHGSNRAAQPTCRDSDFNAHLVGRTMDCNLLHLDRCRKNSCCLLTVKNQELKWHLYHV